MSEAAEVIEAPRSTCHVSAPSDLGSEVIQSTLFEVAEQLLIRKICCKMLLSGCFI